MFTRAANSLLPVQKKADPAQPRETVPSRPPSQAGARPSLAAPAAVSAPVQLNGGDKKKKKGGSSQANDQLIASMGRAADLVVKKPKAKPHTTLGTGTSGTDHQGRNAMVINKAKQDTRFQLNDPTMFSASRMRTDAAAAEKQGKAAEARAEKKKAKASALEDDIRETLGLGPDDEITDDDREGYKAVKKALAESQEDTDK